MKKAIHLAHEFVEFIPRSLKDRTLYVSTKYAMVVHKCCCGCGLEVVTPLSPTDWEMTFDGETVSLYPSIANWSFPCQSHYWIIHSTVRWARRPSDEEIKIGRELDVAAKKEYYRKKNRRGGRGCTKSESRRSVRRRP